LLFHFLARFFFEQVCCKSLYLKKKLLTKAAVRLARGKFVSAAGTGRADPGLLDEAGGREGLQDLVDLRLRRGPRGSDLRGAANDWVCSRLEGIFSWSFARFQTNRSLLL
jgi:hypothetical protein